WSTGQTINPITVNSNDTYGLTVTDANGCTGTDEFNVTIPSPPVVTISGDNQICANGSGSLQATPGFSTYIWNTGGNGSSITVTTAGTYTVTATDAFGCTDSDNFTISTLPPPTPAITGPAAICANSSGTLTVTQSFPNYNWSTGGNTQSIDVTSAGNYTVTVTDANGCTGTASFNLTVNPVPTPTITAAPYACNGQVTLNGGNGFSSYIWSTGQTINPITVNSNDTYGLTVTDANGCTGTDAFFVNIPPPPVVGISGDAQFCQGGNSVLEATSGFNAYVWSTSQTGPTITVVNAGTYSMTATDGFGCTTTDVFPVQVVPNPTPTIAGPTSICAGGSATFTVQGNFSAYAWSTGGSTSSITVSNAGTYTVVVTDANSCTGTAGQTLSISTNLEPQIAEQPYLCDGQIGLDAGAGFSTYLWSSGQNTSTITVNTSGPYTVTVTDNTGCSGTDVVTVNIPDAPVVGIAGPSAVCQNASGILEASPGLGTYVWSNGLIGQSITVSQAGLYTVTATDGYGCTTEADFNLIVNPAPTTTIDGPAQLCFNSSDTLTAAGNFNSYTWSTTATTQSISVNVAGSYTVTVVNSFGCTGTAAQIVAVLPELVPVVSVLPYACTGQITLAAGAGFATYLWSNGQNTATISVGTSGDYTVTATNALGCTGTTVGSATIPAPPVVAISGNPIFCANMSTSLAATPGFSTYLWSGGQTTPDITVGTTGTYGVTATDALGCTATATLAVAAQPLPVPQIAGPATICTNSSGTLSVTGTFAAYLWNTTETTLVITVNAAGTYAVTVTDALGCTGNAAQTVTVVSQLQPQITARPYACNGQVTLDASAGFANYLWSSGQNTPTISVSLSGNYTVTVTDVSGCTGTAIALATVPAPPVVAVSGNPVFCANMSTSLAATPGFSTYLWSGGQTTPDITVGTTGTYGVTATDALGCTATATLAVAAQPLPVPQIAGPATICTNSSGTLSVTGTFAAYLWNTTETTLVITVNAAGTYAVTVTDALGCTGNAAQTVTVVSQLQPQITARPYACNGQVTLDASAGFANYLWSSGQNTPTISVSLSGNYTVTVTDVSGCTGTAIALATVPAPPVVAVSGNPVFCANMSTSLSATPGFAAYLWSTGAATPGISANTTGTYTVTATDALGCTTTATAGTTAMPQPVPAISGPQALCPGKTGTLSVSGGFVSYAWNTGQGIPIITVGNPGSYLVTVTDTNGCTGTALASVVAATADTTYIQQPTCILGNVGTTVQLFPGSGGCDSVVITQTFLQGLPVSGTTAVLSNYNGFAVACAGGSNGQAIATPLMGVAPFSFNWSNGTSEQVAQNLGAGTYAVTFTDANGCSGTASVTLNAPVPVSPVIEATDPTCQNAGIIEVEQVTGGVGPYTVRLVQEIGTTNGTQPLNFSTLDAGTFEIEVTDANGCKALETVVLLPADIVEEFVSDTFEVFKGDTVVLNAGAGITIQPLFITWTPSTDLSCDDCLNPSIVPVRTTMIELDVAGFGGCKATGIFLIILKATGTFYAPNVIKPGSTDNYGFTIYGDKDLVNIRQLQVYDRWGNHMAVFNNIVPNDPARGWDGKFQGQDMNPGVFVWWAELEFSDGSTQIVKGDVTVVR
ncbi:MAG: hypothetical protein ABMA02_09565, partial [Saprospiraceae bacterium]